MALMSNLASILKCEIARVARKEVRGETLGLKKAVVAYRTEIAALKRRTQMLEQELRRLSKASAKAAPVAVSEVSSKTLRFSAKGLASQRRRLALSADDCGRSGGRVGAVDLQLGAGQGSPSGGTLARNRYAQEHRQEGSDREAGVFARSAVARLLRPRVQRRQH